jgi:AcrR family transcriptional regulator
MARPQAADYAAKRKHIGVHAAACFAQLGYPSASMVQIAAASGVSKAGLYHYYDSKEAVLFDVLDGYVRELLAVSLTALTPPAEPAQAMAALIRALLTIYATAQHHHRVLVTDTQHLSPPLGKAVRAVQSELVRVMGSALQAAYPARVHSGNASAHAMMVFGMLNWTFTWLKADGALSYSQYAEQVIATLERGLPERAARAT